MNKIVRSSMVAVALAGRAAFALPATHANAAVPNANVVVARQGTQSTTVKNVQTYLAKLGYMPSNLTTGYYGTITKSAVVKYQKAHHLSQTGTVNNALYASLRSEASKVKTPAVRLDSRCYTGRTICINKTTHKMYWVINGKVQASYDVRTGRDGMRTRSGTFHIYAKYTNWHSTLYDVDMPYTQFFSGGQAVHYSSDFARNGYGVGSHGCVNMNNRSSAKWLYSQTRVGDKVVVY